MCVGKAITVGGSEGAPLLCKGHHYCVGGKKVPLLLCRGNNTLKDTKGSATTIGYPECHYYCVVHYSCVGHKGGRGTIIM